VHPIKSFRSCDCEFSSDHFITSMAYPIAQVLPRPQLIFPSKTWFLGIYWNFQWQKSLKNQYLPHLWIQIFYQINSTKSCSWRSFQQHERHIPIPLKFLATIKSNFHWRNHSIFELLHCKSKMSWNQANAPLVLLKSFPKTSRNVIWSIPVRWIS
jgi:hypothetical protein